MFKWLKKLKCKLKSSCCCSIEINQDDGNLDTIEYNIEKNSIKIS